MRALYELLNMHLPLSVILTRLLLASLCGGLLGWDRQHMQKPAGLRTHMLVSLGAAGYVLLVLGMVASAGGGQAGYDPIRIVQGMVQGIGFLGAGAIIHGRGAVQGLTTAAGIWVVGGIGAACGAGLYGLAIILTIIAYITMKFIFRVEQRFLPSNPLGLVGMQSKEK